MKTLSSRNCSKQPKALYEFSFIFFKLYHFSFNSYGFSSPIITIFAKPKHIQTDGIPYILLSSIDLHETLMLFVSKLIQQLASSLASVFA